jgi:ribosomal protein L22
MSPEESTEGQVPEGKEQATPAAKAKPTAAEKSTAGKSADKKPAAKKPVEKKVKPEDGEQAAAEKPVAKKSAAKVSAEKPAKKKPADAEKASAPKAEKATSAKVEKVEKPVATAASTKPSTASAQARRKVVRAQARYVRTSARKARMVCGHLRGKTVPEARAILAFTPREVARDWSKLLESAVANAENNHELIEDDLFVREAYADEGPTIKRFRPRAQGRATPIRKRTSHLTITLTPKP